MSCVLVALSFGGDDALDLGGDSGGGGGGGLELGGAPMRDFLRDREFGRGSSEDDCNFFFVGRRFREGLWSELELTCVRRDDVVWFSF